MIMRGMNIIKQTTAFLNPRQIPVITVDQPLYALVKKIQYEYPNISRQVKFVAQMGGLHIWPYGVILGLSLQHLVGQQLLFQPKFPPLVRLNLTLIAPT